MSNNKITAIYPVNISALQEGDNLIQEYLQNVAALPIDNLTESEVSSKVLGLKNALIAKNNSYINEMLTRNAQVGAV
jgi:hypothetical protein